MICELVRDELVQNPDFKINAARAAAEKHERYTIPPFLLAPKGTKINDHECYKLVQMGVATPVDDECREWAGLDDKQIQAAIAGQEKTRKGIAPEDYERYDAGEMIGYNPDGSDIPGPNASEAVEYEDDDEDA